mgnify:CR=1 FL=1
MKISDKLLYDFKELVYNANRVLSSEEIYIEKKNKKGLVKKINIKPSVKSYRFEDESMFIILRSGQGNSNEEAIPVRADVLMNLISEDVLFEITRTKFYDESMTEL